MKKILLILFAFSLMLSAKDYTKNPEVKIMINSLVKKHGFKRAELEKNFSTVHVQKNILKRFRPKVYKKRTSKEQARLRKLYPKYGAWDRYARHVIKKERVAQGVRYIKRHQKTFEKAEKIYGVPKEYIAAIIGVESAFGKNVGKYPVFDTLTTLAFEKNRRSKFFKQELKKFLLLSKSEKFNPRNVYGSYAGAIGLVQFMPSNYSAYGVDFNHDGRITLQRPEDAIASVGNYFKKHGWEKNEEVATRVSYKGIRFHQYQTGYTRLYHRRALKDIEPKEQWNYHKPVRLIKLNRKNYDELWYGAHNFYVITRYNHSAYYAMAVHQLAMKMKEELEKDEN